MFINFTDRGRGREREKGTSMRERNTDQLPPVRAPTTDHTCNLLGWRSNQLSHPARARVTFSVKSDSKRSTIDYLHFHHNQEVSMETVCSCRNTSNWKHASHCPPREAWLGIFSFLFSFTYKSHINFTCTMMWCVYILWNEHHSKTS